MSGRLRTGTLLFVAVLSGARIEAQDTLSRAVELVQAGELLSAYRAAASEPDPVRHAQAMLYVRHHAGDLTAALKAGLLGLETAPRDLWLLERTAYLALSLRDEGIAREMVSRLSGAVGAAPLNVAEADRWATILSSLSSDEQLLAENARRRRMAATRSRAIAGAVLALALWSVVLLSRGRGVPRL